ncbi:hypothetical protein HDV03_003274 [Kappamyces sp. JEL0829]|nr:hypothetical protein HDV03_003274 [Kappamyces sp. JEL0829]
MVFIRHDDGDSETVALDNNRQQLEQTTKQRKLALTKLRPDNTVPVIDVIHIAPSQYLVKRPGASEKSWSRGYHGHSNKSRPAGPQKALSWSLIEKSSEYAVSEADMSRPRRPDRPFGSAASEAVSVLEELASKKGLTGVESFCLVDLSPNDFRFPDELDAGSGQLASSAVLTVTKSLPMLESYISDSNGKKCDWAQESSPETTLMDVSQRPASARRGNSLSKTSFLSPSLPEYPNLEKVAAEEKKSLGRSRSFLTSKANVFSSQFLSKSNSMHASRMIGSTLGLYRPISATPLAKAKEGRLLGASQPVRPVTAGAQLEGISIKYREKKEQMPMRKRHFGTIKVETGYLNQLHAADQPNQSAQADLSALALQ